MQLLFATLNQGKLREAQALLHLPGLEVVNPADFAEVRDLDVEETGATFAENAELKARAFGAKVQILTVADDSGLEVAALNGQPGVLSKRFAPGSDSDRNRHLLELMKQVVDRSAQFKTVLCLFDPSTQQTHFFEGLVKGKIAWQAKGEAGFGYDPVFIPDGYDQSFAELGQETKNRLSHRAQALLAIQTYLKEHL
jgi:XTP/dITP diphosphohydrolase